MPQHESTPHHVKLARSEGHCPDISGNDILRASCSQHLGAQINSYSAGNVADSTSDATACVEQSCLGKPVKHCVRQLVVKITRHRLCGVLRSPKAIALANLQLTRGNVAGSHESSKNPPYDLMRQKVLQAAHAKNPLNPFLKSTHRSLMT
jgi:hypothetical protein